MMDYLILRGPLEPAEYVCPRCGEIHLDDGTKPPCIPRTETERLLERIMELEARVTELEVREQARFDWKRARERVEAEMEYRYNKW